MKMYMRMMTLVHNYENEDEYIAYLCKIDEQFISYSYRNFENLAIEDMIQNMVNIT